MEEENITPEGQADGSQLNPPAPEGTVSNEPKLEESMTLAEINSLLGKNFKDKDTALKFCKFFFVLCNNC